jgi:divalent metal cation (Fe/Co/Zn/Cd) transporter
MLRSDSSTRAFATPTIVHFCAVLFVAASLSAPWPELASAGIALGACGVAGVVFMVVIVLHAWRRTDYVPVLEDWIWHAALPLIAYAVLLVAAVFLPSYPLLSLFVVGGVALLLLFVGIHNAWDSVIYIALQRRQRPEERDTSARSGRSRRR